MKSNNFKVFFLIVVSILFISCSSNEENNKSTFNISLLEGQWFHVDLCNEQNNLVLNNNGTYIHTFSGNTCTNNNNDTYQFTGTYSINGDNIVFNQEAEDIIQQGDVLNTPSGDFTTIVYQKIILLNENELFIERKLNNGQEYFSNWHFIK